MSCKPETVPERFWAKVRKTRGCWVWEGAKSSGYGSLGVGTTSRRAHVLAWEMKHGPVPKGQWVLHRCDNRLCVRLDHLFLGDPLANIRDMVSKGRNYNCKLTPQRVVLLREAFRTGKFSMRDLAKKFGIDHSTVSRTLRGQRWTGRTPDGLPTVGTRP